MKKTTIVIIIISLILLTQGTVLCVDKERRKITTTQKPTNHPQKRKAASLKCEAACLYSFGFHFSCQQGKHQHYYVK